MLRRKLMYFLGRNFWHWLFIYLSCKIIGSDVMQLVFCTNNMVYSINNMVLLLFFLVVRPQFTIVPSNTSALLGSDVSLACVARGDPPPEITWKRQRGTLPLKRAHFDEERFLISNISKEDEGIYICQAENKAGSVSASAYVSVLGMLISLLLFFLMTKNANHKKYFGWWEKSFLCTRKNYERESQERGKLCMQIFKSWYHLYFSSCSWSWSKEFYFVKNFLISACIWEYRVKILCV